MLMSSVFSINVSQIKYITSKEKLGRTAASATGEKLPMFVIWKSKNPCCFTNVKNLPCKYKSQKKSWINSEIFEEWVCKLDQNFFADD